MVFQIVNTNAPNSPANTCVFSPDSVTNLKRQIWTRDWQLREADLEVIDMHVKGNKNFGQWEENQGISLWGL